MLPLSVFSFNMMSDNLILLASVLVFVAILITKVGARFGAPALLLFLLLGMAVGHDGLGLEFREYESSEHIGHFAMCIILFAGGLETSFEEIRPVFKQGITLSALGVLLMILITGGFIALVMRPFIGEFCSTLLGCFLLAAIMSSTDSTSVFSVLRGKRLHLREHLGPMLELESGSNDPLALSLTVIFVSIMASGEFTTGGAILHGSALLLLQITIGALIGLGAGFASCWILEKIKISNASLFAIMVLSLGFFAYGLASALSGNGLLAVYITAIMIGNKAKMGTLKRDVIKFFDALTWLMQLLMFLMLGLLARPSEMADVFWPALLLGLFMLLVARPLSVFICLSPFRDLSFKAKAYVSWVGLKGAGPILFALCPVVAGLPGSSELFNIVFLITLLSLVFQGMSLSPVAKWLNLSYPEDPEVETFGLELPEEMGMLRDHVVSDMELAGGGTLRELNLPHGIRVVMVKRDGKFLVPHGSMKLMLGDHLLIVMGDTDD